MGAAPQLCRQVLACLTRQPQLLALQQLPLLQQLCPGQTWSSAGAVSNSSSSGGGCSRTYARLPEPRPSQPAYRHPSQAQQQLQHSAADRPYPKISDGPVQKLYKGRWIIPVRFLVRAKIFQLLGGGSIGVVLGSLALQEASWVDVLALTGLAVSMVAASYCLWYYSRRYVGEMSLLLPGRRHARLSVLDFWGNREDNDVPLDAIETFKGVRPKEISRITSQLLFPVNVRGDRQYYFNCIHEAEILEREIFFKILKGEFDPSVDADADQQQGQQGHHLVTFKGQQGQRQQSSEQQLQHSQDQEQQQQ